MSHAADGLRTTFDLHDFGMRMQRRRLRRTHPDASEADIDDLMRAWLRDRVDAAGGDAVGTPSRRFTS